LHDVKATGRASRASRLQAAAGRSNEHGRSVHIERPPYGTERSYNGLRLAGSLAKREDNQIHVFLIGDAASFAKAGQKVPQGY
jgi:hypothetical protein